MLYPYRFVKPIHRSAASGRVAGVYGQMASDFLLADGPLMSLSPAPDLLAATWALLREAQLVGQAPRANKEAVAAAVSQVNRCPFCLGAHASLIHATGEHRLAEAVWRGETPADPAYAELVAWARATASRDAARAVPAPFSRGEGVEYMGTALVTHFITRMTSVLVDENALVGRLQGSGLLRRVAGRAVGHVVRRRPVAGESLALLAEIPAEAAPAWGAESSIGFIYTTLRATAEAGGVLLSERARETVREAVAAWAGSRPPFGGAWLEEPLEELGVPERAGARLALLAALAPSRVTGTNVDAWRTTHPSDADLVRVLAFGAMTAVDRIQEWTGPGLRSEERVLVTAR